MVVYRIVQQRRAWPLPYGMVVFFVTLPANRVMVVPALSVTLPYAFVVLSNLHAKFT